MSAASTWYEASAGTVPARPPLRGTARADVCVVGGGIAGCSAALELAERGLRVVLLEAERIGSGASGRNGGQLLPGYACGQATLERLLGAADARRLWDWSVEGLAGVRERVARHRIECDLRAGHLQVALKARQSRELAREQALLERLGYAGTQLLDREALRALVPSPRYRAALHDPAAGHLHPLEFVRGLARAAATAGATLHEQSRVQAIAEPGAALRVRTGDGEVLAEHVVLCGNATLGDASSGEVAPPLAGRIMPVGTYVAATEPLGAARAAALVANDAAVADTNWILDYFRRTRDHRLLFGGRVSYGAYRPASAAVALARRMRAVFPQLADARVEYAWGGLIDITLNRAPDFGRLGSRTWYLQGFSGHGLVLASLGGRLVAEAVAGQAERFDVYARIRHARFPGGRAFARPLLVAAMSWYRLRDLLP